MRNSIFSLIVVPETRHAAGRKSDIICAHITDGSVVCPWSAFGRFLPVLTKACAGQVECKKLVSTNANGWSSAMPLRNKVEVNRQ